MIKRISASVVILVSLLFLPFWVTAILVVLGLIYFKYFFEAVFLMFLSDLLYGAQLEKFYNLYFMSFIATILLLFLFEFVKEKARINT